MKFWNDGTIEGLSPNAKLLMLYFITNPYRNESGLYSITLKRMSDDTGLTPKSRDRALAELQESERVFYDAKESVVWVVNAIRHIAPNDNCKKSVRHDIEYCSSKEMSQSLLFYYKSISYQWVTDGFSIGSEPIYRVHGIGYMVQGVQNNKEQEKKKTVIAFENEKLYIPNDIFEKLCSEFNRELLLHEIPKMEKWLKFNKPKKDYQRFIFNWLNKASNDGNDTRGNGSGFKKSGAGGATTGEDLQRTHEGAVKLLELQRAREQKNR